MLKTAPNPIDITLKCRLKIFENAKAAPFSENCSLVACASRFGLIFVGSNVENFQVIQLKSLEGSPNTEKSDYLRRIVPVASAPQHLSVNCDGTILAVVVKKSGCCCAVFYDVKSFLNQELVVVGEVRLSASPTVHVIESKWNPTVGGVYTACKSDGSLGVYEIKSPGVEINEIPPASGATCFCWSPKGKQIAIGSKDGNITQYKPDLKAVKVIGSPPFKDPHKFLSIQWISNYQFIGIFQSISTGLCTLTVVDAPKIGDPSFINYDDICYSNGTVRPPQFYMVLQLNWNILMVASSNSMEVGVLGNSAESWIQWTLGDASRAELPLSADRQDTLPIGCDLETGSSTPIQRGEITLPPAPSLLLLSHYGVLCVFDIINLKQGIPQICSPPEPLPGNGVGLFTKGVEEQKTLKPVTPLLQIAPKFIPPTGQIASKPTSIPTQITQIAPKAAPIPAQITQTTQKSSPIAAQITQSGTPLNLFGGQVTLTPTSTTTPSKGLFQPYADIISNMQDSNNTKTPAVPKATTTATVSRTPPVGSVISIPKVIPKPLEVEKIQEKKVVSDEIELENDFSQLIKEECGYLKAELKMTLDQGKSLVVNLGTEEEKEKIAENTRLLEEFLQEICSVSASQSSEVHILKQNLLQSWAWYEEIKSKLLAAKDETMILLVKSQPLDSASQKKLDDIRCATYYLESQISQAHHGLDEQWNDFQDYCRKVHKLEIPTMAIIFQTMVNQMAITRRQSYILKDISSRVKTNARKSVGPSLLLSLTKPEELSDELMRLRMSQDDIHQIRYEQILNRTKKLNPTKCANLSTFLKKRECSHVCAVKPQLSTSILRSPASKLKQLSFVDTPRKQPESTPIQDMQNMALKLDPQGLKMGTKNFLTTSSNSAFAPTSTTISSTLAFKPVSTVSALKTSDITSGIIPSTSNKFVFGAAPSAAVPPKSVAPKSTFTLSTKPTKPEVVSTKSLVFSVAPSTVSQAKPSTANVAVRGDLFASIPGPPAWKQNFPTSADGLNNLFAPAKPFTPISTSLEMKTPPNTAFKASPGPPSETPTSKVPMFGGLNTPTSSIFASSSAGTKPMIPSFGGAPASTQAGIFTKGPTQSSIFSPSTVDGGASKTTGQPLMFGSASGGLNLNKAPTPSLIFGSGTPDSKTNTDAFARHPPLVGSQPPTASIFGSKAPSTSSSSNIFGPKTPDSVSKPLDLASKPPESGSKPPIIVSKPPEIISKSPDVAVKPLSVLTSAEMQQPIVADTPKPIDLSTPTTSTPINATVGSPKVTTSVGLESTPRSTGSIFGSTAPNVSIFGSTTSSIFGGPSKSSIFGTVTTTTDGAISSTTVTTTTSLFGSTTATAAVFGATPVTTSVFGPSPTTTSTAAPVVNTGIFGSTPEATPSTGLASTPTSSTVFGSTTATSASEFGSTPSSSIFKSTPITSSLSTTSTSVGFGTSSTTASVGFSTTSTTSGAFFSTPATSSGFLSTPATKTSIFGSTTSQTPSFGSTAPATAATTPAFGSTPFGGAATTASIFGGTTSSSLFGATTTSTFGTSATTFGGSPAAPTTTTASVFGQSPAFGATTAPFDNASKGSIFDGAPAVTQSSIFGSSTPGFGGGFGQAAEPQKTVFNQSTFGQSSGNFGTPSSSSFFGSSGSSIFANATTASSGFGSTTTTAFGTNSVFGNPAPANSAPFGSSGGFAANTAPSSSFGFGGLNVGATSTASASTGFGNAAPGNPFATTSSQPSSSVFGAKTTSIFGNSTPSQTFGNSSTTFGQFSQQFGGNAGSSTTFGQQTTPGPFSGGSGSVAQAGFGGAAASPSQKPAGFGGSAVFGSAPVFGSSPSFGGAPAFGSGSSFGTPPKIFGSTNPTFGGNTQSPGFGNMAAQQSVGFGNLAQQAATPSNSNLPFSGASSFSSWR